MRILAIDGIQLTDADRVRRPQTVTWNGKPNTSISTVLYDLWHEYISANVPSPFGLEQYQQLRASIRRTLQAEKVGRNVTKGRISQTKGHAITLGKIFKAEFPSYEQERP